MENIGTWHSTGKRTETVQAYVCLELFSLFVVILYLLLEIRRKKKQRLTILQISQYSQVSETYKLTYT